MYRFSIRDMLWLILSAALATCWFIDHRRADRLQAEYSHYANLAWDAAAKAEREFAERSKSENGRR